MEPKPQNQKCIQVPRKILPWNQEVNLGNQKPSLDKRGILNQEVNTDNQEVNPGNQEPSPANHGTSPREAEVSPGNQ